MLEINKVYCGDCLELMPKIADKSIDMILCDLPYGTTACKWDTIIPFEPLWKQYKRIIKDNGAIVLTASQPFTSKLVMSNQEMFRYEWIWEKEMGSNPLLANKQPMKSHENILIFQKGSKEITKDLTTFKELRAYALKLREHIKYTRKKMIESIGDGSSQHFFEPFGPQWSLCTLKTYRKIEEVFNIREWFGFIEYIDLQKEYIKEDKKINLQKEKGKPYIAKTGKGNMPHLNRLENNITINNGDRFPKTILRINTERGIHPTQKPVALFEYLIRTYTNENNTVLDNCAGSMTTAIACIKTNRNWICMEQEEKYCIAGQKRIDAELAQTRLAL